MKYIKSLFFALIIGLFLSQFFLRQYKDYNGIKVSSNKDILYFIQYGVYSSQNSMEENTISLQNYVYTIDSNLYYVYVGITSMRENKDKIVDYYKSLGHETLIKEYTSNNKEFYNKLLTYDEVLKNTDDKTTISSIMNQILECYEEVVINGNKD